MAGVNAFRSAVQRYQRSNSESGPKLTKAEAEKALNVLVKPGTTPGAQHLGLVRKLREGGDLTPGAKQVLDDYLKKYEPAQHWGPRGAGGRNSGAGGKTSGAGAKTSGVGGRTSGTGGKTSGAGGKSSAVGGRSAGSGNSIVSTRPTPPVGARRGAGGSSSGADARTSGAGSRSSGVGGRGAGVWTGSGGRGS